MATRRKKPSKPLPPPTDLRPYPQVIDTAGVHGWTVHLWRDRNRKWFLDIRDRGDLVARGTSRVVTPECFRELGTKVGKALEKSGRLR